MRSFLKYFLILLLFILPSTSYAKKNNVQNILLLQPVDNKISDAFYSGLTEELNGIKIIRKTIDTKSDDMKNHIKNLINNKNIKAVITLSSVITESVLENRRKNLPVVFASISDPRYLSISDNYLRPGNNLTGVTDCPKIDNFFDILRTIMRLDKVGLIYNSRNPNSKYIIDELYKYRGYTSVMAVAVSNEFEAKKASSYLVDKVDFIIIAPDLEIYSYIDLIINITSKARVPVASFETNTVKQGVVLSYGYNMKDIGRIVASKIIRILAGENAGQIQITLPSHAEIAVNLDEVERLKIFMPKILNNNAINFRYSK